MTEKSSTEEDLLFYSELLRAYFDSTDDAIFVLCDEMKFLSCNKTTQSWLGYSESELTLHNQRTPITRLLGQHYDEERFTSVFNSTLKGQKSSFEIYIDPPQGIKRWVEIHLSKVDVENGDMIVAVARDISERKRRIATIDHQLHYDSLTDLPNRNSLIEHLLESQNTLTTAPVTLTLIVIDLNRFKEINESLGQYYGDCILQEVARRLSQATDTLDGEFVARLGGDEFALVVRDLSLDNVRTISHSIRQLISRTIEIKSSRINLDCGIGIASLPEHTEDASSLIQLAEAALRTAKMGKLGVNIYSDKESITSVKRLQMIADLREALSTGSIKPHYQPIVAMQPNEPVRVEALARWKHEQLGYIAPDVFIPLAEEIGMINTLTSQILDIAVRECANAITNQTIECLSINISSYCLSNPDLVSEVKNCLRKHSVPARAITLELTESAMMANISTVSQTITELHYLGIKLSIDDFGTGYSSLSKLKQLPINELKIDKSFVVDIENNEEDAAIAQASIQMAHSLGLIVIAEGIENEKIWETLKSLNCDYGQGFWIGRPMPFSKLISWLGKPNHPHS